jgi:replication factor C subunit 1
MSHPMAFQKASAVFAAKGGKKDRPDVEDAFEDSDDGEAVDDAAPVDEDEEDISKDKMIKAKKAKKEPASKKAAAPKAAKAAPKKGKK